jgi:hypothetical protein
MRDLIRRLHLSRALLWSLPRILVPLVFLTLIVDQLLFGRTTNLSIVAACSAITGFGFYGTLVSIAEIVAVSKCVSRSSRKLQRIRNISIMGALFVGTFACGMYAFLHLQ